MDLKNSSKEFQVPEAKEIYVLMQNEYRISRNIRAQWFLDNLNKVVEITQKSSKEQCLKEIEIISAIPKGYECGYDFHATEEKTTCVVIASDTKVIFLATRYKLVFCLDLSTSVASVDSQHGTILLDEIYPALKQSLHSICQELRIPGSRFHFKPQLHITVIANIANCPPGMSQVMIQGWILTSKNVSLLLEKLEKNVREIVAHIANSVSKSCGAPEGIRQMSLDSISGSIATDMGDNNRTSKASQTLIADISALNLLRYGILALQLLPENSSAGIVVITDGVISFPNSQMQDSLLAQLRNSTISCSFLQIGGQYHPFSSFARCPYVELMQFISAATYGAYFQYTDISNDCLESFKPNAYHEAFLYWSFQTTAKTIPDFLKGYSFSPNNQLGWNVVNPYFHSVASQSRVRKKHAEGPLKVSLENVISCRLREGYTIKSVNLDEGKNVMEVRFHLPWNLSTNFEYMASSKNVQNLRVNDEELQVPMCHFELAVDGCYEFLHDVTCSDKKPIKSSYRVAVINQFWTYVRNLSHTDQILVQLHSFTHNPAHYTIPDSIKNGVPLFYLPMNSTSPVLSNKMMAHSQFTTFWKPLYMLDINVWQKWMHTHRIGVMLKHDTPLPKNLHLPNASGRYVHIQCRQAVTALNSLLRDYSSFILVENYFYVKFLYSEARDKPVSFYVIRVTSKAPCVVIRLAFLGGLPGYRRHEIVKDLREKICKLTLPTRVNSEDYYSSRSQSTFMSSSQSMTIDTKCCFLLRKPVEKILIRYEKLPKNFMTIADAQLNGNRSTFPQLGEHVAVNMLLTLSKYLIHRRWVWSMQKGPNCSLAFPVASKILSVLTKLRLQEGFHFSHSSFGVIYMAMEIPVNINLHDEQQMSSQQEFDKESSACVVQYLLFPPHTNTTFRDSASEDEDSELPEADGELQLITECWIEPQYGITSSQSSLRSLKNVTYQQISERLFAEDFECISIMTTFEHLKTISNQNKKSVEGLQEQSSTIVEGDTSLQPLSPKKDLSLCSLQNGVSTSNISLMPYTVELERFLHKCHQTESVFPTLLSCDAMPQEEEINYTESINNLLFEFFISNIRSFHDKEITLSPEDCLSFMFHLHHRSRDMVKEPKLPFSHPVLRGMAYIPMVSDLQLRNMSTCSLCAEDCENRSAQPSGGRAFQSVIDSVPKWLCFFKGTSPSHYLLTLVPSNFTDLKNLNFNSDNRSNNSIDNSDDGNAKQSSAKHYSTGLSSNEINFAPANLELNVTESIHEALSDNASVSRNKTPKFFIPVYIYDCILSSIMKQLVRDSKIVFPDSYDSYEFNFESLVDNVEPDNSDSMISDYKKHKKKLDKTLVKTYRIFMDKAYSKAYVCAVYRSLVLDFPVDKIDATAAIDEICEESLLEIDITDFLFTICGHVKDFITKNCIKYQQEIVDKEKVEENENDEMYKEEDLMQLWNSEKVNIKFPLSVLQKHHPCEQLQQKHADAKNSFLEILKCFLKKIPSRPDYYVFFPEQQDDEADDNDEQTFSEQESAPETDVDIHGNSLHKPDNASANIDNPDQTSLNSNGNTDISFSSLDDSPNSDTLNRNECHPLFVHLLCSIRNNQDIKSCSVESLPTCLNDIIQCIELESSEIDLHKLRITLDVTCLALPDDIRNPPVPREHQYSASFSSNSPLPEQNQYNSLTENDEDENFSDSSPSETIQPAAFQNIPPFQRKELHKCIEKIKWLLQDEKVSAALHSHPVTSSTLETIITHVKNTEEGPCCMVKEVILNFVYGPENSIDKFTKVFENMKLGGYSLKKIKNLWLLIVESNLEREKLRLQVNSLDPPLGLICSSTSLQQNFHSTENNESTKKHNFHDPWHFSSKESALSTKAQELTEVGNTEPKKIIENPLQKLPLRKSFSPLCGDETVSEVESESDYKNPVHSVSKSNVQKSKDKKSEGHLLAPSSFTFSSVFEGFILTRRSKSLPANLDVLNVSELDKNAYSKAVQDQCSDISSDIQWSSTQGSVTTAAWDFPLAARDMRSVCTARYEVQESANCSHGGSDIECGSISESCHLSNLEEGYDGDNSELCSEWDWLSSLGQKRPLLPTFWLIMTVTNSKVTIYYHIRHKKEEDDELRESKIVLSQVESRILEICKEVNQMLLLQALHETKICNRLLVPEESDDIFQKSDLELLIGVGDKYRTYSEDGSAPLAEISEKYLEANLRFKAGTFRCDTVWITHFRLHHRLTSGSAGASSSKGIQALHAVLNTFSVSNRKNMFVYQEGSGSVFYLRLHEVSCDEHHNFNKPKAEGSLSPTGSCSSSVQNVCYRKNVPESSFDMEFRPRVNSGHSDIDRQDSSSIISSSRYTKRCISLEVHGIGEVGNEIKADLVQVLQNRLNEGVLDMIIMMLSRNPHCKLTPEDVQFIQNPEKPPSREIHFTIPVKQLCYAHSIHIYLRQNMLHFLHNPKYTDSRKENHFKAYSKDSSDWSQVEDNDIFLYHSYQGSGYSGSKGIACIILSLVTGQGHPFKHFNNSLPNPSAYQDGLSENDFDELTSTTLHIPKKTRAPGPVALIRFQIWTVGKDINNLIQSKLCDAVRHSLWDLLMEYKVLTAPVSDAEAQEDMSCFSEPATPIRTRRTGRNVTDANQKPKEFSPANSLQNSKDISSSVPDIAAKSQSPLATFHNAAFQFGNGPQSARAELCSDGQSHFGLQTSSSGSELHENERKNLNFMFHSLMKPFLQFGNKLGSPALSRFFFSLPSRHSVSIILTEIQNIIKNTARDLKFNAFIRKTSSINADTEFVPCNTNSDVEEEKIEGDDDVVKPGMKRSYIIVARSSKQWKAYMGMSDFSRYHNSHSDALRIYQKYDAHVCNLSKTENSFESTPSSPVAISRSNSITGIPSPRLKSIESSTLESAQEKMTTLFVPRQQFLLIFIQDKEMTVFLYNWSQDITNSFMKQLNKLILWHDSRNSLLSNIVFQKLGLYHSQSFKCSNEKAEKNEKVEVSNRGSSLGISFDWTTAEQLFFYHSPPRESQGQSSGAKSSTKTSTSSVKPITETYKNKFPSLPLHLCNYSHVKDPVKRHGFQMQDVRSAHRRDLQELQSMWQARGTSFHCPYVDRLLLLLKRAARMSHYCLTPILFNPSWRWKVAPIRDHTLQPLNSQPAGLERSPSDASSHGRSRHSSGNSLKNSEGTSATITSISSRSRRTSGVTQNSQGSPKLRVKNPSEETWHQTVCSHYLLEYIQYLHTLGFMSLQTKEGPQSQGSSRGNVESKQVKMSTVSLPKASGCPFYLIRYLLGGLLLFEVGLIDPYAYAHLYTIEYSRLPASSAKTLRSQFTAAFLDEIDKVKALMHLHSFTYDYHLRTIHSYVSGRQLIFRNGYHLTSFLDDFIKYYQKSPNCARNLLYAGKITIPDINMSGDQLYNYIISHNHMYGMKVLRMVPIIQDDSLMVNTEFVLVELSSKKASYKDSNDVCQMGSFDIGLLINQNTDLSAPQNTLLLNYYIILTSQRELFPTLANLDTDFGSFQTVRFVSSQASSGYSSRKTSMVSMITEKERFESSGEETSSNDSRSRRYAPGIIDEEVTYLGYFSSQETMMKQVLKTEAQTACTHLTNVFHRAAIHCRRDFLWSTLLPRSVKEDDGHGSSSKETHSTAISEPEFSELLHLVTSVPLDDIDESLKPFLSMPISWYQSLAVALKHKYSESSREFWDVQQSTLHLVVTHARCPDSFMLLTINFSLNKAELCQVFREPLSNVEHTPDKPSQKVLSLQSLVEDFVNSCCYHLWYSIVS